MPHPRLRRRRHRRMRQNFFLSNCWGLVDCLLDWHQLHLRRLLLGFRWPVVASCRPYPALGWDVYRLCRHRLRPDFRWPVVASCRPYLALGWDVCRPAASPVAAGRWLDGRKQQIHELCRRIDSLFFGPRTEHHRGAADCVASCCPHFPERVERVPPLGSKRRIDRSSDASSISIKRQSTSVLMASTHEGSTVSGFLSQHTDA